MPDSGENLGQFAYKHANSWNCCLQRQLGHSALSLLFDEIYWFFRGFPGKVWRIHELILTILLPTVAVFTTYSSNYLDFLFHLKSALWSQTNQKYGCSARLVLASTSKHFWSLQHNFLREFDVITCIIQFYRTAFPIVETNQISLTNKTLILLKVFLKSKQRELAKKYYQVFWKMPPEKVYIDAVVDLMKIYLQKKTYHKHLFPKSAQIWNFRQFPLKCDDVFSSSIWVKKFFESKKDQCL